MEINNNPQSLAVSDLQLFIAFYMRNGLDLTNHMTIDKDGRYAIEYCSQGSFENDKLKLGGEYGLVINAKFDADGRTSKVEMISPTSNS